MAKVTEISKPTRTSCALRILADKIEKGEQSDFAIVFLNDDDTISSTFRAVDDPFAMIGAIESLKLEILDGNVK